jgi:hypothetical protein
MATSLLQRGFEAQAKSLREFGYPDVTAAMVAAAHAKFMAAEPMSGVIEMFCESAFKEHPVIFGEPTEAKA